MNSDGWTLCAVILTTIRRFREGAASLPERMWRTWAATMCGGYIVLLLFTVGLVHGGRALVDHGILEWEVEFLLALEDSLPISFSTAIWLQTLGSDITLAMIALGAAGIAAWARRPIHALTILIAFFALDLDIRFGWLLWDRARPDLILDGQAAPGFASFPSGHAAKSAAVYGILAFLWARATTSTVERLLAAPVAVVPAALVMLGRLRMGVHWPSDLLAGLLIGGAWVALAAVALLCAERAAARGSESIETAPG